ncbi:MAG: hypothetical protein RLZZ117_1127 [Cyanobacteriota bacterium]
MTSDHANPGAPASERSLARRERHGPLRTTVVEAGVMLLLGGAALIFPLMASLWLTWVVSVVFLVAGLVTAITTWARARRLSRLHAFWRFLLASLLVLAGLWMGVQLLSGATGATRQATSLARVAGLVFVLEGCAGCSFALNHRHIPRWGWGLANGVVTLTLGAVLLSLNASQLPWLLGTLVGVSFLFSGLDLLLFGTRFHQDPGHGQT